MTKIKERNYLGLGIVFAVCVIAISLMFISFSYAGVNVENEDENVNDETITIKFDAEGEPGTYMLYWDGEEIQESINLDDTCKSFKITHNTSDPNEANLISYDKDKKVIKEHKIGLKLKSGFTTNGFEFTDGTYSEAITIKFVVKVYIPSQYFNIEGEAVLDSENGTAIPGAYVKFFSEENNTTMETTADQNGKFKLSKIPISAIPPETSDKDAYVICTAKGYTFDTSFIDFNDFEGSDTIKLTGKNALKLEVAFANLEGSTHHDQFFVTATETDAEGTDYDAFYLPYFGMEWTDLIKGVQFNVASDGSMSGTASFMGTTVTYSVKPIAEDGFTFDYWDINGQKYVAGQTYTIQDDTPLDIVSNYKKATIPATGDALPYAVVIGLGLIAIAAFVIARKQYNK